MKFIVGDSRFANDLRERITLENKFPTNQKKIFLFLFSLEDRWLSLESEFQKHLSSIRFYRRLCCSIMGNNLFASPR